MSVSPEKFNLRNPAVKRILQVRLATHVACRIVGVHRLCHRESLLLSSLYLICWMESQEIKEFQKEPSTEVYAEAVEVCSLFKKQCEGEA
jgi:hypothetical protein